MNKRSLFLLSKWYLDCVSDDGEVFVGYVAELRWSGLSLHYSTTLRYHPRRGVETSTSLRKFSPPQVAGTSIQWSSPQLDVAGSWEATAQPIKRTILESNAGNIEWNCLHPRAKAEVRVGDEQRIAGLGYVDHVTMSMPPWQMPFDELRWGRFLSDSDALVWIDLRGPNALNLAFHNGVPIEDALVTDHRFEARGIVLDLDEKAVLREGPIGKTAVSMIPGIRRLFPVHILETHERKWLARGVLKNAQAETSRGWTIHEIVRFGKKAGS